MTIRVKIPGVGTAEFPDGTPKADIKQAIFDRLHKTEAEKDFAALPRPANQADAMRQVDSFYQSHPAERLLDTHPTFAEQEEQARENRERFNQLSPLEKFGTGVGATFTKMGRSVDQVLATEDPLEAQRRTRNRQLYDKASNGSLLAGLGEVAPYFIPIPGLKAFSGAKASGRLGNAVLQGVVGGGIAGAAEPAEDLGGRVQNALLGGTVGAVTGGVASGAGSALAGLGRFTGKVALPRPAARKTVGNLLRENSSGPIDTANSPLAGFQRNAAGSDPRLLSLERFTRQRATPEGANEAFFQARQIENNHVLQNALRKQGKVSSRAQASQKMATHVQQAYDKAKQQADALWNAIPADHRFTTNFIKGRLRKWLKTTTETPQSYVPKKFIQRIENYDEVAPFGELKDLRSALVAEAGAAKNDYQRRILMNFANDVVAGGTSDASILTGKAPIVQAWKKANDATRKLHELFDARHVRNAMNADESQAATHLASTPERIDDYFNAVGKTRGAKKALADYIVNTVYAKARNVPRIGDEDMLNGNKLLEYLDNNPDVVKKAFSPSQRKILRQIGQLARENTASERASPRGQSHTAGVLNGNSVIDQMLYSIPFGSVISGTRRAVTGPYHRQMETILRDALLDPTLAKTLIAEATPANLARARSLIAAHLRRVSARAAGTAPTSSGDPHSLVIQKATAPAP